MARVTSLVMSSSRNQPTSTHRHRHQRCQPARLNNTFTTHTCNLSTCKDSPCWEQVLSRTSPQTHGLSRSQPWIYPLYQNSTCTSVIASICLAFASVYFTLSAISKKFSCPLPASPLLHLPTYKKTRSSTTSHGCVGTSGPVRAECSHLGSPISSNMDSSVAGVREEEIQTG